MTTIVTTANGTEYRISRTQTQDLVVIWDDPQGDPRCKGSGTKVIEHCQIVHPVVGQPLQFRGTCRYTLRGVAWKTSPVANINKLT